MSETITFATYSPTEHGLAGIYEIGADARGLGVIPEMADAFDHQLSAEPTEADLGELIAKVGPAKTLQDNIAHARDVMGDDAVDVSRDWVNRSGLLLQVDRAYMRADSFARYTDLAVITGGVRNWMQRRAHVLNERDPADLRVLLAGGNRVMGAGEGPDVTEGMTEGQYLREVILPTIDKNEREEPTQVFEVASAVGDEVMQAVAQKIVQTIKLKGSFVTVVSNAGAWVQNTGQLRRAIRQIDPSFDEQSKQLYVVCDSFELGTGVEPTATHQNPFSALGQIVRNAQEFTRHAK